MAKRACPAKEQILKKAEQSRQKRANTLISPKKLPVSSKLIIYSRRVERGVIYYTAKLPGKTDIDDYTFDKLTKFKDQVIQWDKKQKDKLDVDLYYDDEPIVIPSSSLTSMFLSNTNEWSNVCLI